MPPPPLSDITSWPAPAKLNLFLHVVGRRADGYHLLQTVFQLLDIGDTLRFYPDHSGRITRGYQLDGVAYEHDIIVRAARLLQQSCGVLQQGVRIELDKCMPLGGGLGGGSSTAATTLVALNQLWGCGLARTALAELALQLGADVPVFVHGRSAWAEGVGEQLTPIDLPPAWYVVVVPPVSISTAAIFTHPQLRRDCPPITIRDFLAGRVELLNVCEPRVRADYPAVAAALDALSAFSPARLTGTGACVFAAFADEQTACRVGAELSACHNTFVARGVNHSPLYTKQVEVEPSLPS